MYSDSKIKPFAFSSSYVDFNDQNFLKIKQECLEAAKYFEDNQFPESKITKNAVWLRPGQIVKYPKLFVNGCSRFDLKQGNNLGNCWVIAAMANLAMHPKLLNQVVCIDNGDFDESYAGIFHFRFWHNAHWIDIVIDDRLPTQNEKLMFVRSTEENEFWSALLEKAYAKLYGGYDYIIGGFCNDALSNFTGGVTETYDLCNPDPKLFIMMKKSFERNTLMDVALLDPSKERLGLYSPHAYSITKVVTIKTLDDKEVDLIRIRNPWGNHVEWRGAWSDKSKNWENVSDEEKARIKFKVNTDGEFYMSFQDFLKSFDEIEICNLTPDLLDCTPRSDREWKMKSFIGTLNNDSHYFELFDPDDDDDLCTVVISICQFRENHEDALTEIYFQIKSKGELVLEKDLKNFAREKVCREYFKPGIYSIDVYGEDDYKYLLRIFYEDKIYYETSVAIENDFYEYFNIFDVDDIPEKMSIPKIICPIENDHNCYVYFENEKSQDRFEFKQNVEINKLPIVPKYQKNVKVQKSAKNSGLCMRMGKILVYIWLFFVIFGFFLIASLIYDTIKT
ncbi:hypothetical protein PVAND_014820 [Polypedilum vanderplanki]|uniref:Calpain catalytic domain-containing protein n=1 Tax=Polypedilum vanderplanki TaxID=319348 RepID=A0A9J6BAU6_POLVA|nr:hypothetical protein PVAND_014820 [Polypedilum vanderplanki]